MANTFANSWRERILAQMLVHARKKIAVIQSIRTDFAREVKMKGEQILFKVGVRPATYAISPAPTRTAGADIAPGQVLLNLDQWYGAGFRLTRKEFGEVLAADVINDTSANAVSQVVDLIVADVTAKMYKGAASYVGDPGQALFQSVVPPALSVYEDTNVVPEAMGNLANQEVPIQDAITGLLGIKEMTAAQKLDSLKQADKSGSTRTLREGYLGFVGGANLEWQHNLPTHTAGTQTGAPTASAAAVGAVTVTLNTVGGEAIALKEGDIIEFSNDANNTYAVEADLTVGASSSGAVTIHSAKYGRKGGLETALSGGETFTILASHRSNLLYHRNFAGLAMRGPADLEAPPGVDRPAGLDGGNARYVTLQDDEPGGTGLVLTLATFGEYHQTWFEVSALWGSAVIHPWMGTRMVALP